MPLPETLHLPLVRVGRLSRSDLPRLWIPKRDSFYRAESIPTLGTGKPDLERVKKFATEMAAHG